MNARMPGSLASDVRSLDSLKSGAARDPKAAVRQAATQFEALFMQMVMKSMRDAVPRSGLTDGAGGGGDMFQGMLDTQFSQAMTGRPGGLGEMIARQLMRNMGADASGAMPQVSTAGLSRALQAGDAPGAGDSSLGQSALGTGSQAAAAAAAAARSRAQALPWRREAVGGMPVLGEPSAQDAKPAAAGTPAGFVNRMWGAAQSAEQATGVPAAFIVGQAALETGWGRHELKHPDGRTSHNLFGIKAGPNWKGPTVDCATTEYVDGRMVKTVERFRAYGSYQEAFGDWARLMAGNPRYAGVLAAGGSIEHFARNMQRAGYATDPQYASKLAGTITQAVSVRRLST